MWDAKPYMQRRDDRPTCFERVRDSSHAAQDPSSYASATKLGLHCATNWYEGNDDARLGSRNARASFTNNAPVWAAYSHAK